MKNKNKEDKFITKEVAMETFYKHKVVHCKTLEEWQYVNSKLPNVIRLSDDRYSQYQSNTCKHLYYGQYSSLNYWEAEEKTLILSFEDWCTKFNHTNFVVKEPKFVLPDNYCVRHHKEVVNYILKLENRTNGYSEDLSLLSHFPKFNNKYCFGVKQKGYTEITFEQFKKYVLKEDELQQPSKDAPIEEILEYCKKKFPIGTKIKSIRNGYNQIDTIRKELTIQYGNCISHEGLIVIYYYNPKNNTGDYNKLLVEIVEEVKQKPLKATVELRDLPKTYTLEEITNALTKEYDKIDVEDILKVIKTIK